MKYKFNHILLATLVTGSIVASCNKDFPEAEPINTPAPTGMSIVELANSDSATYFFLKTAIARAGTATTALLSDKNAVYTFFAPTNSAFIASGITSAAMINAMPAAQVESILKYHIIGGQKLTSNLIPTTFPNVQEPTLLVLAPPSPTLPPGLRMSIFPSRRGTNMWANNIPVTEADIDVANGVVHKVAALVMPPQKTLKGIIASDPTNFSILSAAIVRADSGIAVSAGLGRLDSVFNYAPANLTFFAPNNNAFRALFPPGTPDAMIIGALNTPSLFTAQTVRGLVAYHLLGQRAFSVNFPATPEPFATQLVIPGVPTPIPIVVSNSGAGFWSKGLANATPSNVVTKDMNAVNGVIHVIDQVMRPQ